MESFAQLAATIFPELLKLFASDTNGLVRAQAEEAVKKTTRTETVAEAKKKLDDDSNLSVELQIQLAQIALEYHKAGIEAEQSAAEADLEYNAYQLNNTENARDFFKELIRINSANAWPPAILSGLVVFGFFGSIFLAMNGRLPEITAATDRAEGVTQSGMVSLLFGAVATAFATILNFWFGSSLGSRRRDNAAAAQTAIRQVADLSDLNVVDALNVGAGKSARASAPVGSTVERGQISGIPAEILDAAQRSNKKWQIPASVILAQFGLESSWGQRMAPNSNNPFGIKAVGDQPFVAATTTEVEGGRSVKKIAKFRKFATFDEAFDKHGKLLATSKYYARARAALPDPKKFANALSRIYATDPEYGAKLIKIIESRNLEQFDVKASSIGHMRAAMSRLSRSA